jgi:tetratricopeptide (TPR) repeat protein
MTYNFIIQRALYLGVLILAAGGLLAPKASAQETTAAISKDTIAELDKALVAAKEASSEARQRLAVRRVIRDAQQLAEANADSPSRFLALEFLFRANQQLIALDDDSEHRKALLDTCRELVKAPDELAELRLEADLLLSQADLARQGANAETRAKALRPFVDRYIETPMGAKVLRLAMVMALELGDSRLVTDLQEMIEQRFAADLEMIAFQRDKLGGQVFGAPFTGTFENSQGKLLRYPMDALGHSTLFVFWSKQDGGGEDILKGIAAASLEQKVELAGRLEIVSVNLDDLPDAGESIVRGYGVDWQVLRLPGGKENPIYGSYVRSTPRLLTVSPTGYTALIMSGTTRQKADSDGEPDYPRMFQSMLARQWTQPRYVAQLSSLMAGDFLILDPEGGIDPTQPPELKALTGTRKPLARTAGSVPEETLRAIQDCFIAPPLRYRASHAEIHDSYAKAVELCRKAIADHPTAPDLWIVRNRLITALLGLWKTNSDLGKLEEATSEAKTALSAGLPAGCEVIARFCIARESLRQPGADSRAIIDGLVAESGGESASGPALAAAALLSLEVADRKRFEDYRGMIIKEHAENPAMWIFSSFLLDRYHRYWLFQVPFTAGWSFGRREDYFLTMGAIEDSHRVVRTELRSLDGKPIRIPDDLESEWTAVVFAAPGPWSKKRDDELPASPERLLQTISDIASRRPAGDLKVVLAVLGEDADAIRSALPEKELPCPIAIVPGGIKNPLVHRVGILSEDKEINSLLLRKDGRIAAVVSGLAKQSGRGRDSTLTHVVEYQDEQAVSNLLAQNKIEDAKDLIFGLAPPFDPEAKDEKGRKLRKPDFSLPHLRARARVYQALGEIDLALADAEEATQRQLGTDGGMSLRTDELDETEQLRDAIREQLSDVKKSN